MKKTTIFLAMLLVFAFGVSAAFAEISAPPAIKQISALREQNQVMLKSYQDAKAEVLRARAEYDSARAEWLSARQTYLAKRNQTVGSANTTAFAIEKGRIFLNRTVNNMISHLELVKSKVQDMKVLSDTEKADIVADLDSRIAALSALEPKIAAVSTKSQLVAVSQEARELWSSSRRGIARAAGQVEKARIEAIMGQAANISVNAQIKIDEAKAKGIDTTELETILADYNKHVADAKASTTAAQTQINGKDFEAARESLKTAKEQLREAQKTAKEFVKKAREIVQEQRRIRAQNSANAPPAVPGVPAE